MIYTTHWMEERSRGYRKRFMKRLLLCFLPVLLISVARPVFAQSGDNQKPNLLVIYTDEHNFRTLGCYRDQLSEKQAHMWGNPVVETPHIDSIAEEGAIANSFYPNTPVCSPSAASLISGMYPHVPG